MSDDQPLPWGVWALNRDACKEGVWPGLALRLTRGGDGVISARSRLWRQAEDDSLALGDVRTLRAVPAQADRPLVVRLESPLTLAPGASASGMLALPAWLALRDGERDVLLAEWPLLPVSDTWVGESPKEGEFGYGITLALADKAVEVPGVIWVPVAMRNRDMTALTATRLLVPAVNMGVYADKAGLLWGEALEYALDPVRMLAEPVMGNGAPVEAELVSPPRRPREKRGGLASWTTLFER